MKAVRKGFSLLLQKYYIDNIYSQERKVEENKKKEPEHKHIRYEDTIPEEWKKARQERYENITKKNIVNSEPEDEIIEGTIPERVIMKKNIVNSEPEDEIIEGTIPERI